MIDKLREDLIRDEGVRESCYLCTAGKKTIGVGRNLDDVGLMPDEVQALGCSTEDLKTGRVKLTGAQIDLLLSNDVDRCKVELSRVAPWWIDLPEDKARGLLNMMFNMGPGRLKGFKKMLVALQDRQYPEAARQAEDSSWFSQVGNRAHRVCKLFDPAWEPRSHPFS